MIVRFFFVMKIFERGIFVGKEFRIGPIYRVCKRIHLLVNSLIH